MNNSSGLIGAALAGKRGARTPIFDLFSNDAVIEHFAAGRLDGTNDRSTVIKALSCGVDGTRGLAIPRREGATYADEWGNSFESSRWTTWMKQRAVDSPEGWIDLITKDIENIESNLEVDAVQAVSQKSAQTVLNRELNETVYFHCTPSTALNMVMFGYHCGIDSLSYLWMDHPNLISRWLRVMERKTLKYIKEAAHRETSPAVMIYSDVAFKGRLMFSRDMFSKMGFFDDVAAITAACHKKGLRVIFHSDGYIMDIMDDLIAAGIDGINPIEKAAGMDVFELRKKYSSLTLVGGVDVTHLLVSGAPGDVRAETRKIIDATGSEGHLLIGSSTEVGNDVPLANYLAFHDEVMRG